MRLGILASHPIQYQAPLFRELAHRCDLHVFFAHKQTPAAQAAAGFDVPFEWDVDLLSGYASDFLHNVAWHPDTGRFTGCDTPGVAEHIATGGFDAFLVLGWHLKCFWQAVRACHRHRVPVMIRGDSQLATPRSLVKRAVKAMTYPWIIRQFDALLYVGKRNREYLEHYGAQTRRLYFAPHCVDTEGFAEEAAIVDRRAVRTSWGLRSEDRAVLFVGKFVKGKRPADLVKAASVLRERREPVVVVMAGDGPERESLRSLGESLGVPIVFLGFCNQSRLPEVYRAADALVLPSETETWGLVVNEAMACGTPCVVSDTCGCAADMVQKGVTGEVYEMGSVPALAGAIHDVLAASALPAQVQAAAANYSVAAAAAGILKAATAVSRRDLRAV